MVRSLCSIIGALLAGAAPVVAQSPPDSTLRITYLANMGVTLEAAGLRVVIDGFHHGELADYARVPARTLSALESGTGGFARVDAGLATHRHRDHFAARSVAARVRADSGFRFLAARETVDSLLAFDPSLRSARVVGMTPEPGGERSATLGAVTVTVLDLPHNATRTGTVENVGFLVRLGRWTVLHVGDADPGLAAYRPHRLPARGIDVAVVPFWYLMDDGTVLRDGIGARHLIATHVPPADTVAIRRRIQAAMPGVVVFATAGASHVIR